MATCNPTVDSFIAVNANLAISEKYKLLMQDTIAEDSIYARAKDTLYHLFEDLQLTETEKANVVAQHVAQMTNALSEASMSTALAWAKEERDGAYTLAKVKADTEVALAQFEKVKSEICLVDKETQLKCAQVTATSAGSVRDNGTPTSFADDGCSVLTLSAEGLKYHQTKQVQADTYTRFADAYRKSGVVEIGEDPIDGTTKGLSGDAAGYTHQQEMNAERQRLAYEDSKRNHVANSAAAMIGQMLTAEISPNAADVQRWRDAVDFLNTSHSTTSQL